MRNIQVGGYSMVVVDDEEGEFEQRLPGTPTKSPSENMRGKEDKEDKGR
jgi:hypothetical protein